MNTINTISANAVVPSSNVDNPQYSNVISQMDQLMINLGVLFGKMRDLLRQYQQIQQSNAYKMQKEAFDTRMEGIQKEFAAENTKAWGQILSGALGLGTTGSEAGQAAIGDVDKQLQAFLALDANSLHLEAQKKLALADYQSQLADQQIKNADNTIDKALKVSNDLRDMLSMITEAYQRMTSIVHVA